MVKLDFQFNEEIILEKVMGESKLYYDNGRIVYDKYFYDTNDNNLYLKIIENSWTYNRLLLLEKVMGESKLYYDNGRIVYDKYFYDTNDNNLYLKIIENSWTYNRLLLGEYIYSKDSKYEKLKAGENYYQYPLKVEFIRSNRKKINDEEEVVVLAGGEVAVVKADTNYVIRSFEGFNVDDRFILWDLTYENNKVYNIAENDLGELELLAIDINTGDKQLVKKVNESKDHIKHLTINNGELGYLVQDGKKSVLVTYNIETKEEKNILVKKVNESKDHIKHLTINNGELGYLVQDGKKSVLVTYNIETKEEKNIRIDIAGDVYQILFNDKYIVVLPWDERTLYVLGKRTGDIISKSENMYFTLFDINEDGILVDTNGGYEVLDYSLNKLKVLGKRTGDIISKSENMYFTLFDINEDGILVDTNGGYEVLDYSLNKLKAYSNYDKALKYFEK